MTLPECPRCEARQLEKVRADTRELVWCYCTGCSATVLVDADGCVVHQSANDAGIATRRT